MSDVRRDPVNHVRLSDSLAQLIVDECVRCGGTHRHGADDPTVARGELSHRVAHCDGDPYAGYYLKLAPDADVPARWLQQVLNDDTAAEVQS